MSSDSTLYDRIAGQYLRHRSPDPRIARAIHDALGDANSVVNVGAGIGSYEPTDRELVAVEPSEAMIALRPATAAPAIRASAEQLPFSTGAFDAALAILTVHHWSDRRAGLAEMRRVARDEVVVLTWDPAFKPAGFWLIRDYFPDILDLDRETEIGTWTRSTSSTSDIDSLSLTHAETDVNGAQTRSEGPERAT